MLDEQYMEILDKVNEGYVIVLINRVDDEGDPYVSTCVVSHLNAIEFSLLKSSDREDRERAAVNMTHLIRRKLEDGD